VVIFAYGIKKGQLPSYTAVCCRQHNGNAS